MKRFLLLSAILLTSLTSCFNGGDGGGEATPESFVGQYTTYEIDNFGGNIIDTRHSGETKVKVELYDIFESKLDFTFLGVQFVALMPKLIIKLPALPYTTETQEDGSQLFNVEADYVVPMLGDTEREDYTTRNIKASIGRNTIEFQFELQKNDSIYRVVFSNKE